MVPSVVVRAAERNILIGSVRLCVCAGVRHCVQPRGRRKRHVCVRGSGWIGPHVRPPAPGAQHHHLRRPSAPPSPPPLLEQAGPQLFGHNGHGRHGGENAALSPPPPFFTKSLRPGLKCFFKSTFQVVILDVRVPCTPVARLNNHRACVNGIAWAPHSSCHICTAGNLGPRRKPSGLTWSVSPV